MIADALMGNEISVIIVNNKRYTIKPPTIATLCGVGKNLVGIKMGEKLNDILASLRDFDKLAAALSWFIKGDDSLSKELLKGTLQEILKGLEEGFRLIDIQNFYALSVMIRNVEMLIAKPKR